MPVSHLEVLSQHQHIGSLDSGRGLQAWHEPGSIKRTGGHPPAESGFKKLWGTTAPRGFYVLHDLSRETARCCAQAVPTVRAAAKDSASKPLLMRHIFRRARFPRSRLPLQHAMDRSWRGPRRQGYLPKSAAIILLHPRESRNLFSRKGYTIRYQGYLLRRGSYELPRLWRQVDRTCRTRSILLLGLLR